jgi:hypothetical protein
MRTWVGLAVAALAFGGARLARTAAPAEAAGRIADEPYAPSPAAAPIVSLGYREAVADLLYVRAAGYLGSEQSTASGVAALAEAIAALDPGYRRIYDWGARAITLAKHGVDRPALERALALLDAGARRFPRDWKLPYLAGQIYLLDLQTTDPAQRRAWDDRAALLLESAIRKPGAPADAATTAAALRTRLGQHQRAADGLREMLLVTSDEGARARIAKKLGELEHSDAAELAAELQEQRRLFETRWLAERPAVPETMYVLLGAPLPASFDLGDLAAGPPLVGTDEVERLEPVR